MKAMQQQTTQPQTAAGYAPEIEARRTDYERLCESLVTLAEMHADRPFPGRLEVPTAGKPQACLSTALETHVQALMQELDWFDARMWRRFYVEMRLMSDQLQWEREQDRWVTTA